MNVMCVICVRCLSNLLCENDDLFFFFKQKTAYEMRISDWSADVCSSDLTKDGQSLDAVAQVTKSGHIFLFDRVTGAPVFPIDEVQAPPSDLPGEEAWPSQPVPTLPAPFARQHYGPEDVSDRTPEAIGRAWCRESGCTDG